MFRERLSEIYDPYRTQHNLKTEKPILNEWKLGLFGLLVSLGVIVGKIYFANADDIKQFIFEQRLFTNEIINEDGQVMYHYTWKTVVKYSNIWLPLLCGGLTTYFTWMMVYLDSHVPGIQPPSPLSPSKYKTRSGHSFHLNYVFAVVVGVLVALYLYGRNISIEYL